MDSNYDDTNKGVLFDNKYKEEGDRKPDYTGNINVEGKEYKIKSWKNVSRNGNPYISIQLETQRLKIKKLKNINLELDLHKKIIK